MGLLARKKSNSSAMRRFARRFDLVYFGSVSQRRDDHAVIRGVTASSSHADRNFIVGSIHGHDLSLVERTTKLDYPGKPATSYRWIIATVPLGIADLPRMFIDRGAHDETFYANIFTSLLPRFHAIPNPKSFGEAFRKAYRVYVQPDKQLEAMAFLTPELTAMIAHHFHDFDYEITEKNLFVYTEGLVSESKLERMARVALWLAEHLKNYASSRPP